MTSFLEDFGADIDAGADDSCDDAPPFAAFCASREDEDTAAASGDPTRAQTRRMLSERRLEEVLPWEWEPGATYHVLSAGDIDTLAFFKAALRQQPLDYLTLCFWCISRRDDIPELRRWLELGRIRRLDTAVDHIFPKTRTETWDTLVGLHKAHGGRAMAFQCHAKIAAGFGPRFDFALATSGNLNTTPRIEHTAVYVARRGAADSVPLAYKAFLDKGKCWEGAFPDWRAYDIGEAE